MRKVAFAAAAVVIAMAGCDGGTDSCTQQTPPIENAPGLCTASPGATLVVPITVCPRCDQAMPTCAIDRANLSRFNEIELVPLSAVCDADPNCPLDSCAAAGPKTLNCTLTVPATEGDYTLVVVPPDPSDPEFHTPLDVRAGLSGGCT